MPRLNVTQRPDTPNSRQLTPDDAGAGVGRAVQRFGRELGNAVSQVEQGVRQGQAIKAARDRQNVNFAVAESQQDFERAAMELENDPDLDGREEKFKSRVAEIQRERGGEFRGESANDFRRRAALASGGVGLKVSRGVNTGRIREGHSKALASIRMHVAAAARAGTADDEAFQLNQALVIGVEADEAGFFRPGELELFQADMTEQFEAERFKVDVERNVEAIMLESGTRSERIEAARGIENETMRADVLQRVKIQDSEERAAERERLSAIESATWEAIDGGGGLDVISDELPAQKRRQMRLQIEHDAEKKARGEALTIKTDPTEWHRLNDMRLDHPDAFALLDLSQSRRLLTRAKLEQFEKDQEQIRGGFDPEDAATSGADRSFANILISAAEVKDTKRRADIQLRYRDAAEQMRADSRKELTRQQREDLAKTITSTIEVPRRFTFGLLGKDVIAGEVTTEQAQQIIDNPPNDIASQALELLKRKGVTDPDEDELEQATRFILQRMGVNIGE